MAFVCAPTATHCPGGPHHTQGAPRCMDEGGCHPWVFTEPADQILCTTDPGAGHQHKMEGVAQRPVWRFVSIATCLLLKNYMKYLMCYCCEPSSCVFYFFFFLLIGIKKYIVNVIIKLSSTPESLDREKVYLNKLNMILVQVSDNLLMCNPEYTKLLYFFTRNYNFFTW